jgi:halimadienyl-diphosphate synthase
MNPWALTRDELVDEARNLLGSLGEGSMSQSAYDTAWVARIPNPHNPEEPLFQASYDWLLQNQRSDGSWGAQIPFAHDRVMSTLAGLLTVATTSYRRQESDIAARRAIVYLNQERPSLREDPAETVGFELILPELIRQAQLLGLRLPYDDWAFVEEIKADKLKRIPPIAVYGGPTPLSHSLEYLGDRLISPLVSRARSANGSYGGSPSASAYVVMHTGDANARQYLERLASLETFPAFTYLHPFENFERAWVLDALQPLAADLPEMRSITDSLRAAWTPIGMAWSKECEIPDADDTAAALSLFAADGHPGTNVLELYETPDCFQTFIFERNASNTTNAHVLSAIRRYQTSAERRRMAIKIVQYLEKTSIGRQYWYDKWHASAFYATCCSISALSGVSIESTRLAVEWVLGEQHENGSWGVSGGTKEETAWALWALADASSLDPAMRALAWDAVDSGTSYLGERFGDLDYEALWIGKSLYTPYHVVRAAIIGALVRSHAMLADK